MLFCSKKRKPMIIEDKKENLIPMDEFLKNPNPVDMFSFVTNYSNDLSCLNLTELKK